MRKINVFIGYDDRESIAWHVLASSIYQNCSLPVSIWPVKKELFSSVMGMKDDRRASNAFSFTRFLVPFLSDYEGMSVFMDCDMLITADLAKMIEMHYNESYAVMCVKHDYTSKVTKKYLGNIQENYPRKNWSSFVFWNNGHPSNAILTPTYVESATPAHLHRFEWLTDGEIGALPKSYNHLVGEYDKPNHLPENIHWTLGGPYFSEYAESDYADLWFSEKERMSRVD